MKKLLIGSALAALSIAAPAALRAQALPQAMIAMVDAERVGRTCTPCAAALAQLQAQDQAIEARRQQLAGPLQTELNALQAATAALPQGQQPDAALRTRIQAFQTQQQNAERELEQRGQTLQRNAAFVQQQINQRLLPAIQQIGQQRNATMVMDRRAILVPLNPAIDITDAVLAVVNQNTAAINVTAPPPQAPAAQPGVRPAQPAQPNRPRPQGR
jgi:Skp family chaperone for outer membrane proteins